MNKIKYQNTFNTQKQFSSEIGKINYFSLEELSKKEGFSGISSLPYSIKILLEAVLRQIDDFTVTKEDLINIANWSPSKKSSQEIPFKPARVIMQDFTGVPGIVDLAAMRDAMKDMGKNPNNINPLLPVDLVIDHSVQLDETASSNALQKNLEKEFQRNQERYEFLKWGSQAFQNFRVIPPGVGIIHQVNLEYLASVVQTNKDPSSNLFAFPDSLVGTDSHTTMINGLGVLGWGVGGIEAEAVMLGQPIYMLIPEVVGFKLDGNLKEGMTATDLVLTIVQKLRKLGVVGKFVEFYGDGLSTLSLADRATIANMAPEYGATMGFFPVDNETLKYLQVTGRTEEQIALVEQYTKEQGLFGSQTTSKKQFSDHLELDMGEVEPSISGPKRPQDRISLKDSKQQFRKDLKKYFKIDTPLNPIEVHTKKGTDTIQHGSIVIASITSCTNTSNPSVILGAGILAKKATEKGLTVKRTVKTSLAPGSRVVNQYLSKSGLLDGLEKLGFHIVGYGCATCIGNSGPIDPNLSKEINNSKIITTAILSGNRNFEGRIHPDVKANYLASPPLVVAYALAGTIDINFEEEPLGVDFNGNSVYLKDIWPTSKEIKETVQDFVQRDMFQKEYTLDSHDDTLWSKIPSSSEEIYKWKQDSTYIKKPGFFEGITKNVPDIIPIKNARVLICLGDSITTDHISPAGSIPTDSPAADWLKEHGVQISDFNSFGSRRGNDAIMTRGTFGNIRIKNMLIPGKEGGYTLHLPTNKQMSIYEASVLYKQEKTPLIILAGQEYGTGSSRDWAAKGTSLLGVKCVIAKSYERIHRSNLIGMGVLPLEFLNGNDIQSLELTGKEFFSILGLNNNIKSSQKFEVQVKKEDGSSRTFSVLSRLDTPVEVEYYHNKGILHTVLRKLK